MKLFDSLKRNTPEKEFYKLFASHPIFHNLKLEDIYKLYQIAHHRQLQDGEILFSQNHQGHCLYFILKGQVEIHPAQIILEAGDTLGEAGALGENPRDVQAKIQSSSHLLAFFHEDLKLLTAKHPLFMSQFWMNIAHILAKRLVATP